MFANKTLVPPVHIEPPQSVPLWDIVDCGGYALAMAVTEPCAHQIAAAVNHADDMAALLFRVRGELAAGGALWLLEEVDTALAAYDAAKEAQP